MFSPKHDQFFYFYTSHLEMQGWCKWGGEVDKVKNGRVFKPKSQPILLAIAIFTVYKI